MTQSQQGPIQQTIRKSAKQRMLQYSSTEVEETIRRLLANGELRDYDDEIANRLEDAADLCAAVREFLA